VLDTPDTIAAIATPPGRGGVGIVRLSGAAVSAIAHQLINELPAPRTAVYRRFHAADGSLLDAGLALYFPAPHSYTGEDVLELHGHGGPVIMDLLLQRVLQLGARLARPGEFTERAFLNGKLDLAQAEAVADLIDSSSAAAARLAVNSLQGAFSQRVHQVSEQLLQLRMRVEAAIDFPDEDIDLPQDAAVKRALNTVQEAVQAILATAEQGALRRDGFSIAIVGRPNAGKSTLLNRLTGQDTAIVTAIPGTTRDVLRAHILLDGLPVNIVDTAGLRDSDDVVEQEGVRRAWEEVARADAVLYLIDSQQSLTEEDQRFLQRLTDAGISPTRVHSKIDLRGIDPDASTPSESDTIFLSAKTGAGLDDLTAYLKHLAGFRPVGEGGFLARRRHLDALQHALAHLDAGAGESHASGAIELLAEELRRAHNALGEITGTVSSDDLLGHIFADFCIGK
jgi:tRNA modification GTPase